jgi:signal transduction histidine kinase
MLTAAVVSFLVLRFLVGFHVRWPELLAFTLFVVALWLRHTTVYAGLIVTAFISGLFSAWFVLNQSYYKEKENMKVLAASLGAEHDPVAELMIDEINDKISDDAELHYIMRKTSFSMQDVSNVHDYLTMKYFKGYWNKYDLSVYLCNPGDIIMVNDEKEESCSGFFRTLTQEIGTPLRDSHFYYLDYQNGQITYFGAFYYPSEVPGDSNGLYIQLDSRLLYEQLGYPELLLDETTSREVMPAPYSYAKYYDGRLVAQNGTYSYSLTDDVFVRNTGGPFTFIRQNGYSHLVYHENSPVTVVLSMPVRHFKDYLVSFSYFFIFFFLIYLVVFSRSIFRVKVVLRPVLLKQKIMLWTISMLLFTLLLIGTFSIVYNIRQFRANHYKNLSEKILSVYVELEHKLSYESYLDRHWSSPAYPTLNDLMVKFSNVFYTDINLYDPTGRLLATSRPEIFRERLAGNRMNEEAFYHMSVLKESEFIHKESLGDLEYLSAYMPFLNNEGQLLAYLNLPYFTKQYVLTREVSNMIVGIINYMVVLILLTIVLAVIIADKITTPLRAIQEKIGSFRLGKDYEHIIYKEKDEIGSLVDAYNRMIDELARNVELLARSERESAWREMAKQVAHEIKNPLTPMKLSVQQLQRAHKDKKEDFDEMFEKLTATLVEQIDRLSYIASAFSHFARLPKMKNEPVDLVGLLQDIIYLFRAQHGITFTFHPPEKEEVWVFADKDLMESVFTNLIKNAIQALSGREDGEVEVHFRLMAEDGVVRVYVRDNGEGIPEGVGERLFEPNFTTKSSGMGMGLAIVKKIVEDAGGRVWYESNEEGGTTFIVELFLYMRGHD